MWQITVVPTPANARMIMVSTGLRDIVMDRLALRPDVVMVIAQEVGQIGLIVRQRCAFCGEVHNHNGRKDVTYG